MKCALNIVQVSLKIDNISTEVQCLILKQINVVKNAKFWLIWGEFYKTTRKIVGR